jgi:drug/metabolite transporter (DMT)-like permease
MLALAIPALSALGAWLVLDQRLTVLQATGMAVVICSLVVVVRFDTRLHTDHITGT